MSTYVIAEAGVNHNGSLALAKQLVKAAAAAGADAVKFQTFKAENVISRHATKAAYQEQTTGKSESQLEMVKKLELSTADHLALVECCREEGIQFLSTPFDMPSISMLAEELKLPRLKLPSGEITNAPFLVKAARTKLPLIISTGMCTLEDIEQGLGALAYGMLDSGAKPSPQAFKEAFANPRGQALLKERLTVLHCTTEYPTPFEDVNLRAMETLKSRFGLPVGYSDHTVGITVPVAAVARGAVLIEKHFTLDRKMEGPDHRASLEPAELVAMVRGIREVERSLGSSDKKPAPSEIKNMTVARKSLVAATKIRKGEIFTEDNLTIKRPGSGVSPFLFWDYLGQTAEHDYQEDELIK